MRAGSTIPELFQNYHEKKWSESEKWGRKALVCKGDGYMWGLGGAKKGKVKKVLAFIAKLKGPRPYVGHVPGWEGRRICAAGRI